MKSLMLLLFVSFSLVGCATTGEKIYEIAVDLTFPNGKKESAVVRTYQGKKASIEMRKDGELEGTFIDVVASEGKIGDVEGILMQFELGYVLENGKRSVVAKPALLTKAGGQAVITTQKANGKSGKMSLKVTAKRRTSFF